MRAQSRKNASQRRLYSVRIAAVDMSCRAARGSGADSPEEPGRAGCGADRARPESAGRAAAVAGVERPTWGLVETLDIMADDEMMDQIAESERDRLAGRVVRLEDFLAMIRVEDKKEGARAAGSCDEDRGREKDRA